MENKKSGPWRSKIEEEMWKEATEQMNGYVPWKKMDVSPIIIHEHPGIGGEPFTIRLSSQWFNPGDILIPQYTFWQKFFRCITFGLYKPKTFAYKAANFDPNAPSWTTVRKDDVPYIINIITNGENKEGKV